MSASLKDLQEQANPKLGLIRRRENNTLWLDKQALQ
jgi:hypothetical protein